MISLKGKTVLIIDSDLWFREFLQDLFESVGMKVVSCDNGRDAIDILDENEIDIIFMDLILPELTGVAFLHEKISYSDLAKIPVVVSSLTSWLKEEYLVNYGVGAFLNKETMKPEDILGAVRKVL